MIKTNIFKTAVIILCLASGLIQPGQAQSIKEYAPVDSLKVGDTFDLSITLNRTQPYDRIIFPDTADVVDPFEIRSRSQFKPGSTKDSVHYKIQFFGTSDTTLAPLPVLLVQGTDTTVLHTNPIAIKFQSVLASENEKFRPMKPIFDFAAAWWPYILAFLLLCIAGYFLYRYFTREEAKAVPPEPFTPVPFVNPLKQLQDKIGNLEQMELSSEEDFDRFYVALGDAIRQYFEDLHRIPALESTSGEIIRALREQSIDQSLITDTRIVLQEADMVKFANFTPTDEQARKALQKAHNFLDRAKEIDGPRIEQLRRDHQSAMEEQRIRHEQQQNRQEVNA